MRLNLSQRLSLVFAVLLLVCCGTSAWLQVRSSKMHELEVVQGLSRDLAQHIAHDTVLMDSNGLMPGAVRELFSKLMLVNPSVEVYLLDSEGGLSATRRRKAICAGKPSIWRRSAACSMTSRCRSSATTRAVPTGARCSVPRH
jgi:hypothetical protein